MSRRVHNTLSNRSRRVPSSCTAAGVRYVGGNFPESVGCAAEGGNAGDCDWATSWASGQANPDCGRRTGGGSAGFKTTIGGGGVAGPSAGARTGGGAADGCHFNEVPARRPHGGVGALGNGVASAV